jgi:hypothetical protein
MDKYAHVQENIFFGQMTKHKNTHYLYIVSINYAVSSNPAHNEGYPIAPSHDHVIAAKGFPPSMTHVRVTLLPSWIGPFGVCVIFGNVGGASKDKIKFILR